MTTSASQPAWMTWTGHVLTAIPTLMLLFSASMKLSHAPAFIENWVGKFGFQESLATTIGVIEIACALLYVIPKTRVLGAILVTGYLGGAVVTHVRVGDPSFFAPALLGVFAWGGLFLRDSRLRELLPVVKEG